MAEQRRLRRVALIVESQIGPRRRMLDGVARYMHEHEPWVIYLKPAGVHKSLEGWLRRWKGDGMIAAVGDTDVEFLADFGIPVVDVIGVLRKVGVPLVHTHDYAVGRMGAEHLIERGYRHYAFVGHPGEGWSAQRLEGFRTRLQESGVGCLFYAVPFPNKQVGGGPEAWEQQQSELADWIRKLPKPIGVMCCADLVAQGFLTACLRAEAIVPEQVAVLGCDNDEIICQVCHPPLSSVIINDSHRGYVAAAVLDRLMSGEPAPAETMWIEPVGVAARASTDILAVNDEIVVSALRYIRDRACDGIGVDDVVAKVPVSRTVLERRFRKVVGRPIKSEIVRLRLNRAVQLLSETDMELKAIAVKAGFLSTSYMSAMFREKLGRTPGSYRGMDRRRLGASQIPEQNQSV